MKTLRYGCEIETLAQTRHTVAKAIWSVVGGSIRHIGRPHCYDPYEVTATDGRVWKVMADSSLNAPKELQAEIVSPILRYEDIETLQEVIRAVRRAGAKCDLSTGIHIHVGAERFDAKSLRNLVKIFNKQEELIMHALDVRPERRARWCRGVDQSFLAKIEAKRPRSLDEVNRAWFGELTPRPHHYHHTRYRALNVTSLWQIGTIEIRAFNGTLHAGKVKAYIQFSLALAAKALKARSANSKRRPLNKETAKYDFRVFLLSLGLIGPEFKTARLHLLSKLKGSAAWKHGRPNALPN